MSFRRQQLAKRVQDLQFIIDKLTQVVNKQETIGAQLAQCLDLSKIGAAGIVIQVVSKCFFKLGHSFGGGTAIALALTDARVTAAVPLDSWFEPLASDTVQNTKLKSALFLINSEKWQWQANLQLQTQVLKNAAHADLYKHTIPESMHQNFSDIAVIMPNLGKWASKLGGNPVAIINETNTLMAAFFRHVLVGNSNTAIAKYKFSQ